MLQQQRLGVPVSLSHQGGIWGVRGGMVSFWTRNNVSNVDFKRIRRTVICGGSGQGRPVRHVAKQYSNSIHFRFQWCSFRRQRYATFTPSRGTNGQSCHPKSPSRDSGMTLQPRSSVVRKHLGSWSMVNVISHVSCCDSFSMIFSFGGGVFLHNEAGFDTEIIEVTKEGTVSVADGPRLSFTLAKHCMVR